jgi:hypothetical protein
LPTPFIRRSSGEPGTLRSSQWALRRRIDRIALDAKDMNFERRLRALFLSPKRRRIVEAFTENFGAGANGFQTWSP